jgi:hypothetical protein
VEFAVVRGDTSMTREEIDRIENNIAGEVTPGYHWIYEIQSGSDLSECVFRIKSIMKVIAAQSRETWPTDDVWRALLPYWFIDHFAFYTKEESQRILDSTPKEKWSEIPWDFYSWLDAIRDRGWEWWSSKEGEDPKIEICLNLYEWPANLESFEQIVRAVGAKFISTTK